MLRSKTPVKERDEYQGLQRIFPSEDSHHSEVYEMIENLRHLYTRLAKNGVLSAGDFERKMFLKPIVKKNLMRVDLTICF